MPIQRGQRQCRLTPQRPRRVPFRKPAEPATENGKLGKIRDREGRLHAEHIVCLAVGPR